MNKEGIIVFGGIIGVIVFTIIAAIWFSSASCAEKSVSFQNYKYSAISGCMVKHHDRWLPLENIRGFDDKD